MLAVLSGRSWMKSAEETGDSSQSATDYVQTVMGHASAQTTLDVYGHLFETGGQDAARGLECWLATTSTSATRSVS